MKECPFKEGDHIYNLKTEIKYIVSKIYKMYNVTGVKNPTPNHYCQSILNRVDVYIVNEKSSKGTVLPLILIKKKNWKDYLSIKDYRKLKLQKLNENNL